MTIEDRTYDTIEVRSGSRVCKLFLDRATHLLVRQTFSHGDGQTVTRQLGDYRKVGALRLPRSWREEVQMGDGTVTNDLVVDRVELDVPVSDRLFAPPDAPPPTQHP